jgi:PAS domain S-box-containing protein
MQESSMNPGAGTDRYEKDSLASALFTALQGVSDGVWDWEIPTNRIWLSRESLHMFGYSSDESPPTPEALYARVNPEDLPHLQNAIEAHLRGETESFAYEFRVIQPDGASKWLLGRGRCIERDPSGAPLRFIGTNVDITHRRDNEETTARSEERYRLLAETTRDLIIVHDFKGIIRYMNRAAMTMSGLNEETWPGTSLLQLIPASHADRLSANQALRREGDTGEFRYEIEVIGAAGVRVPLEVTSVVTPYEGEPCILAVGRDITDRKAWELELSHRLASEKFLADTTAAMLRTPFDELDDAINAALGTLGRHEQASYTFIYLLSEPAEEHPCSYTWSASAAHPLDPVDKPLRLEELPYLEACMRAGDTVRLSPTEGDAAMTRPEISLMFRSHIRSALVVPMLAGDKGVGVLGLGSQQGDRCWHEDTDKLARTFANMVTSALQRRQAHADQQHLYAQLLQAQKMESVGRLAGGVAHDFNNMLSVILGNVELALAQCAPGDPLHRELEEIASAASRSADLTRQLLAFARKQAAQPKVLDLNDVVGKLLGMLRRLMGEGIQLNWKPAPALWRVRIDPGQVDQILANLCVNARDAMDGRGEVHIATHNVPAGRLDDSPEGPPRDTDHVMLDVTDKGSGMDAATQAHLFEPFFTTKPQGEGTGLGLATVYGIVRQNSGCIQVESEEDKGTSFRIYLPRVEGAVEGGLSANAQRYPRGSGQAILLVEDEKGLLNLARRMLERAGYRVLAAESINLAIDLAERNAAEIHALLTGVVMPGGNGTQLANRVRKTCPDIRVIYMSGHPRTLIAGQDLLPANAAFLQKPFTQAQLCERLHEVLRD